MSDLSYLLLPRGQVRQIGFERGRLMTTGIAKWSNAYGSYRYIMFERGMPIGALQIVARSPEHGVIANVYVLPSYRRQGIGRKLLERARKNFVRIEHSAHLSEQGLAWKHAVRDQRRRRR